MGQTAAPLDALLRSLRQGHQELLQPPEQQATPLTPLELAELLWLAPRLPSQASANRRAPARPAPSADDKPARADSQLAQATAAVRELPPPSSSDTDPLRHTRPTFFPDEPVRPRGKAMAAGLLPDQILPSEADVQAVLGLRLQDVRLIRDAQPLQRALAPFAEAAAAMAGAIPASPRRQLDEAATVDAYARSQRLWPVYATPREPPLRLLLLVDGGLSMEVWQRLAAEVLQLFTSSGAFADVRLIQLDPAPPAAMVAATASGTGHQVVLVLSDGAGQHWWHGGAMHDLLKQLSQRLPTAILQVLPEWMWRRTALGVGAIVATQNRQPLATNGLYRRLALPAGQTASGHNPSAAVLPLVRLDAEGLAGWSRLVLGQGHGTLSAFALPEVWPRVRLNPAPRQPGASDEERVRRQVRRWRQRCSGSAETLLRVLAAAPVLTLPVMRLLQLAMVPEGGPLAMAEVLLSGLLQRLEADPPPPRAGRADRRRIDRVQFDFLPGVRSVLLSSLTGPETAEVLQRVSALIEERWDQCEGVPPFQAYLADPSLLPPDQSKAMAPFAKITAEIIARLPGPAYQQLAEKLRCGAEGKPADPFPPDQFAFNEIDVKSAVLLRDFPEPVELIFCTAQIQKLPLQEYCFTKAILKAGQPVFSEGTAEGFAEPLRSQAVAASGAEPSLTLLHIGGGSFLMGSPPEEEGRFSDEGPQHTVHLDDFFLSDTPVTQAQWRAVAQWVPRADEEPWPLQLDPEPVAKLKDADRFRGDQRPVVNVTWHEAMEFCRRLQVRTGKPYGLPSEAQWEYACRAGTTTPFHFGDTLSTELANYNGENAYGAGVEGEYRRQTTDVAQFPANDWG
ncbi:MAG: formylglycine-generating enzyme family protein, partial [Synechococcaceae cyanobacterium]|nr:formylglycine-generating enzyme family protein [Synechococcaceae cyanobacterium]